MDFCSVFSLAMHLMCVWRSPWRCIHTPFSTSAARRFMSEHTQDIAPKISQHAEEISSIMKIMSEDVSFLSPPKWAEMENGRHGFSLSSASTFLQSFSTPQQLAKVEAFHAKLEQPDEFTKMRMLGLCLKAGKLFKALRIFRGIKRLDSSRCKTLAAECNEDCKMDATCMIFEDMKKIGCITDTYKYSAVIKMLVKIGLVDRAVKIFDEMLAKGYKPSRSTSSILLSALEKDNNLNDAMALFQKILNYGICLDSPAIPNLLAKTGQLSMIYDVLRPLKGNAKKKAYEIFIHTLGKLGYIQEACKLSLNMREDGYRYNKAIYLNMIRFMCQEDEVEEAWTLLREMEKDGYQPPTLACNVVLSALVKKGNLDDAWSMFDELKLKGPSLNVVTYNTLMLGIARAGKHVLALNLLNEMEQLAFRPNAISFNSLIHVFCKLGNLHQIHELLRKMELRGLSPDVITYNSVIQCFGKAGYLDAAVEVFVNMKEKGISPTSVTYNILLLSLAKAGRTDLVLSFYEEMKQQGCMPDILTFSTLDYVARKKRKEKN